MLLSKVIGHPVGGLRFITAPTKKKEEDLTNSIGMFFGIKGTVACVPVLVFCVNILDRSI